VSETAIRSAPLGRSGIEVCRLCLGGNVFGGNADEKASFAVLDTYPSWAGTSSTAPTSTRSGCPAIAAASRKP
jgi:hypothetical protein